VKQGVSGNSSPRRSSHPGKKTVEQAEASRGPAGSQRHSTTSKVNKTAVNRVAIPARAKIVGNSRGDAQGKLPVAKPVHKKAVDTDLAGKKLAKRAVGVTVTEAPARKPAVKAARKTVPKKVVPKKVVPKKVVPKKVVPKKVVPKKVVAKKAAFAVGTRHNPTPHRKPRPKESKY